MESYLAIFTAIAGLLGGAFGAWLLSVYKEHNSGSLQQVKVFAEQKLAENEQAFKIYKDLLDILKGRVHEMEEDIDRLEKKHLTCAEENASLKADVKSLSKEVELLKKQIELISGAK